MDDFWRQADSFGTPARTEPGTGGFDLEAISVRGPVREANEDAALAFREDSGEMLALLADGMGGHARGREAAELVVRAGLGSLCRRRPGEDWRSALARAVAEAHEAVRQVPDGEGMGSTALFAVVDPAGPTLNLAHVGDSRAYLARGHGLLRLTRDHSVVGRLVEDGHLSEEEAFEHPERNVLLQAMGQETPPRPDLPPPLALAVGDRLLLSSDGLHGFVPDPEICRLLARPATARELCHGLLAAALERGSDDNISVIVLRLGDPPRPLEGTRR